MNVTIDLELLAMFVAVADAKSFSRAATKLGTTTATVSRGIARLEALVEQELVHRTTRHVSLSSAGTALYERTAPHVSALRETLQRLPERTAEPSGTLRITAPYDLGATLLGEVVARYLARYPKVRVDADFTNRKVKVVAEGFDLAIRASADKLEDSSLSVRRLPGASTFLCFAAPNYLARRGTPRTYGESEHDWLVLGAAQRLAPLPKGKEARLVSNDFLFLRDAARSGAGIALMPGFLAGPLLATGELVQVLPSLELKAGGLVLLSPPRRQRAPNVVAFRELLIETLKRSFA